MTSLGVFLRQSIVFLGLGLAVFPLDSFLAPRASLGKVQTRPRALPSKRAVQLRELRNNTPLISDSHRMAAKARNSLQQAQDSLRSARLAVSRADYDEAETHLVTAAFLFQNLGRYGDLIGTRLVRLDVVSRSGEARHLEKLLDDVLTWARRDDPAVMAEMVRALALWNSFRLTESPPPELLQRLEALVESQLLDSTARAELQNALHHLLDNDRVTPEGRERHARRALAFAIETSNLVQESRARAALGAALLLQGNHGPALAQLNDCLRLARQDGGAPELEGFALALMAEIAWLDGHNERALLKLEQAVDRFDQLLDDVLATEVLGFYTSGGRQWLDGRLVERLSLAGRDKAAFQAVEKSRLRTLLPAISVYQLSSQLAPDVAAQADIVRARIFESERSLIFAFGQAADILRHELHRDRKVYKELLSRLEVSDPEYAALARAQPIPVGDIQALLDSETSLVSYFVGSKNVLAWVVTHTSCTLFETGYASSDLRNHRWNCLPQEIGSGLWKPSWGLGDSQCNGHPTTEPLYVKIFSPLRPSVSGQKLLVVPDGDLHSVPFAALRDPETGRYLVEDFLLGTLPNVTALPFLRRPSAPPDQRALVLGRSSTADWMLAPLSEAPTNALIAARALGSSVFMDKEAAEGRVHEARQLGVLHLEAYNVHIPEQPAAGYVDLAANDHHDGRLTMGEVFGMDLAGLGLLTLPAARNRSGEIAGAQATMMASAFLHSGVGSVLSKIWRIREEAGMFFLVDFYGRVKAGMPPAQALREAQLTNLQGFGRDRLGPWALFVLHGWPDGAAPEKSVPVPAVRPTALESLLTKPQSDEDGYNLLRAQSLATASKENLTVAPQRALLLAVEAWRQTGTEEALVPAVEESLRGAVAATQGIGLASSVRNDRDTLAWVEAVAFSEDSRWLAIGNRQGAVNLWDLAAESTATASASWQIDEPVSAISLSSEGRWLAAGDFTGAVRLWDLGASGPPDPIVILQAGKNQVHELLFTPDRPGLFARVGGQLVIWNLEPRPRRVGIFAIRDASALSDQQQKPLSVPAKMKSLLDLTDRKRLYGLTEDDYVTISPCGQWLASFHSGQTEIRLWNVTEPTSSIVFKGSQRWTTALTFSPDGLTLASGDAEGTVRLWNFRSDNRTTKGRTLRGADSGISVLSYSPNGRWLVAGTVDLAPRLFDLSRLDQTEPRVFQDGRNVVLARFVGEGQHLVIGDLHGGIRLWDLARPKASAKFLTSSEGNRIVSPFVSRSADGRWLSVPFASSQFQVWDFVNPTEPRLAHSISGTAAALGPSGHWLAVATAQGEVHLRPLQGAFEDREIVFDSGHVDSMSFHPSERFLLVTSHKRGTRLWDLRPEIPTSKEVPGPPSGLSSAVFSPDGAWVVGQCDAEELCLYSFGVADNLGRPLYLRDVKAFVLPVFSGDSNWLISGGATPRSLWAWPLTAATRQLPPRSLEREEGQMLWLAASPDGRWLASAALSATPRLWDLQASDPSLSGTILPGHNVAPVLSPEGLAAFPDLDFSPDSRHLATVALDGVVRVWEIDKRRLIERACRAAGRNLTTEEWERFVLPSLRYECTCPELPSGMGRESPCGSRAKF